MIKLYTFFSARTSPNFSHFPRQVKTYALPYDLASERDPKNILHCQHDVENYMDQALDFLLHDRDEYIHTESSGR